MQAQSERLVELEQDMAAMRATSSRPGLPWVIGLYAQGLKKRGQTAEARLVMDAAMELAQTTGERIYLAELHRIEGELAFAETPTNLTATEGSFRTPVASRATSRQDGGAPCHHDSRAIVGDTGEARRGAPDAADIYNWFTEGPDTADLEDAKALLDELSTYTGVSSLEVPGNSLTAGLLDALV